MLLQTSCYSQINFPTCIIQKQEAINNTNRVSSSQSSSLFYFEVFPLLPKISVPTLLFLSFSSLCCSCMVPFFWKRHFPETGGSRIKPLQHRQLGEGRPMNMQASGLEHQKIIIKRKLLPSISINSNFQPFAVDLIC